MSPTSRHPSEQLGVAAEQVSQGDTRLARIRQKIESTEQSEISVATDAVRDGKLQRTFTNGVSVEVELI